MRMSTDEIRDDEQALETIAAAADAGITVFDTARAYGDNERLLANGLRRAKADATARIVTKGGMSRAGGGWIPDGRAKAIRADCEASLVALDGLAIDLYLIHAPDPRTPWRTSVRALARLVDDGLVRHVGLSNVNRPQLDEALDLAPITAVQVALSPYDDRAVRGGVVERCAENGIAVIAHSPLGGPKRAGRLGRHEALVEVADSRNATPWEVALAWLLDLSPTVVAIPGARRPETARSAAGAATLRLEDGDRAALAGAFGKPRPARRKRRRPPDDSEVVVVMGIPGAGKSLVAEQYVDRGYVRLNRDERGGTLRQVADALDEAAVVGSPARGARQHVPDAGLAQLRPRRGEPARDPDAVRLARHAARPGAGQPRGAAARALRVAPDSRRAAGGSTARARRARPDLADAHGPRARAPDERRGFRRRGADAVRADAAGPTRASGCVRRGGRGEEGRRRRGRPAARLTWSSTGAPTAPRRTSPSSSRSSLPTSPARSRALYVRIRPALRPAGAGRRFRACPSPSRGSTLSTPRDRSSSEPRPHIGRLRRRSAPATSRSRRPTRTARSGDGCSLPP